MRRHIRRRSSLQAESEMPAKSKAQQRLFGMAYAVKKGELSLAEVPAGVRDKVRQIVRRMSLQDVKDFASTKRKGLPAHKSKKAAKKRSRRK